MGVICQASGRVLEVTRMHHIMHFVMHCVMHFVMHHVMHCAMHHAMHHVVHHIIHCALQLEQSFRSGGGDLGFCMSSIHVRF